MVCDVQYSTVSERKRRLLSIKNKKLGLEKKSELNRCSHIFFHIFVKEYEINTGNSNTTLYYK